jgi:hypothetical protein
MNGTRLHTRANRDRLFEVKDIHDQVGTAVPYDDVCANRDTVTIRGWRRQTALEVHGNRADITLQFRSHVTTNYELPFQAWRKPIFLGQAGRKVAVVCGIPAANFVTVVVPKAVPSTIVVIVMVLVFVAPVAIVMVITVVFIGSPGEGPASGNRK